ncbi:MAG: hypothetical protein MZU91_01725 [Desulfosudis oleivorans]|nr:hypothetical protein [Desulfosudis oleivorans]
MSAEYLALISTEPLGDDRDTHSPSAIPSPRAVSGWMSSSGSGERSLQRHNVAVG